MHTWYQPRVRPKLYLHHVTEAPASGRESRKPTMCFFGGTRSSSVYFVGAGCASGTDGALDRPIVRLRNERKAGEMARPRERA